MTLETATVARIVNFHIPADDVDRAAKFYHDLFGWEFKPFPDSPVPYLVHDQTGGGSDAGITAAITQRQEIVKAPVPTIEVDDIDQSMIAIVMKGGQQGRVQNIPGLGRFGYAIDSEGNVIALLQH